MPYHVLRGCWLAGWLLLPLCQQALAQQPTPGAVTLNLTELDTTAQRISELNKAAFEFDDLVDSLFTANKPASSSFTEKRNSFSKQVNDHQVELAAFNRTLVGGSPQLVGLQVASYIEALSRYQGALQELVVQGKFQRHASKHAYSQALYNLAQGASGYLQAVQQAHGIRALEKAQAHLDGRLLSLAQSVYTGLDTLTLVSQRSRRLESWLHPYAAPRFAVLAGTYQANAYSLGALYHRSRTGLLAAGALRYDASADTHRFGVEATVGYRASAFGLLAGPALHVSPGLRAGWKLQALLLKQGWTLGAAYDSRLGPGVLAAFGFK